MKEKGTWNIKNNESFCIISRCITLPTKVHRAFLIAQLVKNLSAMQKNPVHFLGWEDPLEKG